MMISLLPTELLSLIFDNLANKNDQLSAQLVCYSWHGPAKRAFYKGVTIQQTDSNADSQSKLAQFIQSMAHSSVYGGTSGRLPSAGQYVKQLSVHLEIVLKPKFMPKIADYQLLAAATPNLEEIGFPITNFWNYFMSANLNQYWTKLRTLPPFRLTPTTPVYQLDQFRFFHASLTNLDIEYVYSGHPQQLIVFTQMIRLFTNLEKMKITTNSLYLSQMIPILAVACPKLTNYAMVTPAASPPTVTSSSTEASAVVQSLPKVPKLHHLDLNVRVITPQLIQVIAHNFPNLQNLVLQNQQKKKNMSASEMEHLIRFATTSLSQASIQLFLSTNEIITLSKLFLLLTSSALDDDVAVVAVNLAYDSRSSCTTSKPDLSYHRQKNTKDLYIRFQGPISAQVQHQDLPHMQLLKMHGALVEYLKIQLPLSLYQAEKMKGDNPPPGGGRSSCIQTILMDYCPNLAKLHVTQCYFDISKHFGLSKVSNLTKLTLEKSTITSASLHRLSQQCPHLNYLVLDHCEFDGNIDMPRLAFKNLSIINNAINLSKGDGGNGVDAAISITEHGQNRTTTCCYFSSRSLKIALGCNKEQQQQGTLQNKIHIQCWSVDQFRFNRIPVVFR